MSAGRVTAAELAAALGVAVPTVMNDAMVCGIGDFRGPYTAAQAEAIRAARRERLGRITQRTLAAELGVTPVTLARRASLLRFGGQQGYTPEQAEALRRSVAATPPGARRRGQG